MVAELVRALGGDDWVAVRTILARIEAEGLWPQAILRVRHIEKPQAPICEGFHSMWTAFGHRIRAAVADDVGLLDALHVLLPPYSGADITLYRGESVARWRQGTFGSSWTNSKEIAVMFERGLNAVPPEGGVLLSTDAPAKSIITGPSRHSIYLGEHEFVVDRRKLTQVQALEMYPAILGNS
jgi:hypothetical protein